VSADDIAAVALQTGHLLTAVRRVNYVLVQEIGVARMRP
jgi:hypothetical protein